MSSRKPVTVLEEALLETDAGTRTQGKAVAEEGIQKTLEGSEPVTEGGEGSR